MLRRRERFCGNILLYDYLSTKRAPVFLNRSLSRAFRVHQYILINGDTVDFPGQDHELRAYWKPPSWDELDDMVDKEKSKGSFVLEMHGLRALGNKKATKADRSGPAKKTQVTLHLKSTVELSFFPQALAAPCTSVPSHNAVLRAMGRDRDGDVSIEMEPFTVRPNDLSLKLHHGKHTKACKMVLAINLASLGDAVELWDRMGLRKTPHPSSRFFISYEDILQCPSGREVLPIQDHARETGLGLEVSMYWTNTTDKTVLTAHNRHLRGTLAQPNHYPTPPMDIDRQPQFHLTFVFADSILTRPGLFCPYPGCQGRKQMDFEDLQMHLDSWHDQMHHQPVKLKVDDNNVEHWRFDCEVSNSWTDQRASGKADEPFDVRVLAPDKPFDRQRHLQGNDEFHRTARLEWSSRNAAARATATATSVPIIRRSPVETPARPAKEKKMYIVPKAPAGVTFFRSRNKRPLKEDEQISESDDEPDTSWIELRRSAEFDKISSLSDSGKRLLIAFDSFMQDEHTSSIIHAGESLVRFARGKGAWIWQAEAFEEFSMMIEQLLQDEIISMELHAHTLEIVKSHKPSANTHEANEIAQRLAGLDVQQAGAALPPTSQKSNARSKPKKDRKGKGKAKVTCMGHLTPGTGSDGDLEMTDVPSEIRPNPLPHPGAQDPEIDPPYELCLCGEDALSSNGASLVIACNNVDCIRRHFHIDCLQDKARTVLIPGDLRKSSWLCNDCKPTLSIAS